MTKQRQGVMSRLALLMRVFMGCAFSATAFAANHTVHVNDGSVPGLVAALNAAAGRPPSDSTEIVLSGKFVIAVDQDFPAVSYGDVTIRGGSSAAVITAQDDWAGPLFDVGEDATLRLANLEFADIRVNSPGLILNRGDLDIRHLNFINNAGYTFCLNFGRCFSVAGRIMTNFETGRVTADAVSFIGSGTNGLPGALLSNHGEAVVSNVQVTLPPGLPGASFANEGSLRIVSGSFLAQEWAYDNQLLFSESGVTTIGNSIVVGYSPQWCALVQSLGHNLVEAPDCDLAGEDDLVGIEGDLIFVPVEANWNPGGKELLTHALEPLAKSVAVDSGSDELCNGGSLLGANRQALDGDGDGVAACDRGAVERVPATLAKGGINGLYYNPQVDGHYVYIAETTYTTMVMWTTFDNQGRPAWVFGIGDDVSSDGRLVTQGYINRDGAVNLDGTLVPANAEPWGRIEVSMQSCNQGRLSFESHQPGFGRGQFPIQRLAFVDQVACVGGP